MVIRPAYLSRSATASPRKPALGNLTVPRRSTLSVQARPGRVAFDTVRSRQGRGGEAGRAIYVADSWSHVSFGLTRPHASGATRGGHQIQGLVGLHDRALTAQRPQAAVAHRLADAVRHEPSCLIA